MSARTVTKDIIPDKACIGVLGQSLVAAPLGVRVVENFCPVASPDKEQSTEHLTFSRNRPDGKINASAIGIGWQQNAIRYSNEVSSAKQASAGACRAAFLQQLWRNQMNRYTRLMTWRIGR
jgi:hypothetical protein